MTLQEQANKPRSSSQDPRDSESWQSLFRLHPAPGAVGMLQDGGNDRNVIRALGRDIADRAGECGPLPTQRLLRQKPAAVTQEVL